MIRRNTINRITGKVFGWFDSKEARVVDGSLARFNNRARLALTNLEDRSVPATLVVSSLADSGTGTLREAFTLANADTLDDTITFSVTGTINLNSSLPFITGNGSGAGNLTLTGPGSSLLTVRRSPTAPNSFGNLLVIQDTGEVMTASVSGMTFSGATTGDAVFTSAENVTFTDVHIKDNQILTVSPLRCAGGGVLTLVNCVISGNSTTGNGGAIYLGSTGSVLTLTDSILTGNTCVGVGGGIRVGTGGTVNATNTTISNNRSSNSGGGIYFLNGGNLNLEACTISGNASSEQTGGVYFYGTIGGGGFKINNSTVSGNISRRAGGGVGLYNANGGTVFITNSTIVNNTSRDSSPAFGVAGGLAVNYAGASVVVDSCIISGNFAPNVPANQADVDQGAGTITITNSAIGVDPTPNFVDGGGVLIGGNLDLGPLTVNTPGKTATHSIGAASIAIDKGSTTVSGTTVDQNGVTRPNGAVADIGAFERIQEDPDARVTSSLTSISAPGGGPTFPFTIEYEVNGTAKISAASIGNNDIRVTRVSGPAGFTPVNVLATAGTLPGADANPLLQGYSFPIPGGAWDAADNGVYEFSVEPNSVLSDAGKSSAAVVIGRLTVGIAQTFTVTTLADSGAGSLREAFNNVNVVPSNDTIVFDPALTSGGAVNIDLKTALPVISDSVTITGPGSAKLTVRRELGSVVNFGVFTFINSFANSTVNVSGITANRGQVANDGAGLFAGDETVTLNDVVLTGNSGRLGGGLFALNGNVTINNSTLSSNTSSGTGGAMFSGQTALTIRNSTINNNSATSGTTRGGGGLMLFGNLPAAGVLIENTTISGNTSGVSGGGVEIFYSSGTININNSTITGNKSNTTSTTAGKSGGGIAIELASNVVGGVTVNINSTIVSGNTIAAGPAVSTTDIASVVTNATLNISKSAIGVDPALTFGSPNGVNIPFGSVLGLGSLASNGGLTKTISIPSTSAAKNAGIVLGGGPTNDQRGVGFPRNALGGVDIGAFEFQGDFPSADPGTYPNVTVENATTNPYVFEVTFKSSPSTVVVGSLDDGDEILVTGPNGFSTLATFVSATPPTDATTVVAKYKFTAPGGTWDGIDNGTYTVSVVAGQVLNSIGNAVPAGIVGTFQAQLPITRIVTNANDSGVGSFRQAVVDTNANPAADFITFDPTFFDGSSQKVITFALGESVINDNVTITGPGAAKVAFNGNGTNRMLNIGGTGVLTVNISGITFTNGNQPTGDGGAIAIADEKVTLDNAVLTANTATNGGGAILINAGGVLTVNNSTISNNQAGTDGGGIVAGGGARVVLFNTTVSGNTTGDDGGGLYFINGGSFLMDRSTISGNVANGTDIVAGNKGGGGIYFFGAVNTDDFIVVNSTISGNSHTSNTGGGIAFNDLVTVALTNEVIIRNSTIVANSAPNAGGGISNAEITPAASTGNIDIISSVVSGNLVTGGPNAGSDISNTSPSGGLVSASFSAIGEDPITGFVNGGNNLAFQAPLNLGALAFNAGGTTKSHLPGTGSPLINAGSNPAPSAANDQNGNPRTNGIQIDIGSVETGSVAAPVVSGIIVNGNPSVSTQRSRLTTIQVNFASPVNAALFQTAGAVFLTRVGIPNNNQGTIGTVVDSTNGLIISPATGTVSSITLTFQNISNAGINSASLADGRWELTVVPASFVANAGNTGNQLRRLFGDIDNNGTVDGTDFGAFPPFGAQVGSPFDFDNNNDIDGNDFSAFGGRFGYSLT